MPDKVINYKEYSIEVNYQGNSGDNTKIFFRVLKDDDSEFTVWQILSGTEYRGKTTNEILEKLTNDGLEQIKSLIDDSRYEKGSERTFYSSK